MKSFLYSLLPMFLFPVLHAQTNAAYLATSAVPVANPLRLSDSVYHQFAPFRLIMMGEMHGTNEPAQLVTGLATLFTGKGDSVLVGLEIPPGNMKEFMASHADSDIYLSNFFHDFYAQDGRESMAWAGIISRLRNNHRVQIFFFDMDKDEGPTYERDSLMYVHIKSHMMQHPGWRTITISGNAHALVAETEKKTASYLRRDASLHLDTGICTMGHYYLNGACRANFGHGLEERQLGRPANYFDSVYDYDKYLLLMSRRSTYPYTAMYYTRTVTPAAMVKDNVNISAIKLQLADIHERDQKTRKGIDSAAFTRYIDSANLAQVTTLIEQYGWPGRTLVGPMGNFTVWLVIQHADLTVQEKYLPLLQASVAEGESRGSELAYLLDRVLMRQGKKQVYGTQVVYGKTGGQVIYPIEDEKNVNKRRAAIDLQPMEEYARNFGINYQLPAE